MITNSSLWPRQPKPSPQAWTQWRIALQTAFNTTSLGKFNQPIVITRFNHPPDWKWFLNVNEQRLYQLTGNRYTIWQKILPTRRNSRRPKFFNSKNSALTLPLLTVPCTIYTTHNRSSKSAFLPLPSHHAQHHMEVPQKSINI
jgi:hypothetical protein